ncbi:hypothetical protein AB7M35_002560 [Amorphus suaedae]
MRQGNPNKRLRGRNRKGPNPLTKTFESNGPDVKIRGTALHVAEKYLQLSRDAQVSGDRVMGENYLQHAEHYFRILAAAQGPNQPQQSSQRDDDQDGDDQPQQYGQHRGGQNGNGHSDPAASDQPSDSGFERHGANGHGNGNGNGNGNGHRSGRAEIDADRSSGDDGNSDQAAEASGSGNQAAEAPSGGDEASEAKPRRRARAPRTPRGRPRRASADAAGEAAAPQPGNETAPSDA